MDPSGNALPFSGTPALNALIIAELATITLSTSAWRAEETVDQSPEIRERDSIL